MNIQTVSSKIQLHQNQKKESVFNLILCHLATSEQIILSVEIH
jgi:hypothetical protein